MYASLPQWAQWIRVIGVPIAAVAVAVVGSWIALKQKKIASVKLQHDLFDRRFAILESLSRMLNDVAERGGLVDDSYQAFLASVAIAPFLFSDSGLVSYLQEVKAHTVNLMKISPFLSSAVAAGDPRREKAAAVKGTEIQWLIGQTNGLADRFQSSLQLY